MRGSTSKTCRVPYSQSWCLRAVAFLKHPTTNVCKSHSHEVHPSTAFPNKLTECQCVEGHPSTKYYVYPPKATPKMTKMVVHYKKASPKVSTNPPTRIITKSAHRKPHPKIREVRPWKFRNGGHKVRPPKATHSLLKKGRQSKTIPATST